VHQYGFADLKVCVPKWLDLALDGSNDLREFYASIEADITRRGLTEHIVFHDWIPQSLMPEYYSLGSVTLALGSFVESFGNSVYESLGCGTPSIPARISSHRELLPEHLLDKVDYGDIETAADIAAGIIGAKQRTSPETMQYLHEHYSVQKQRAAYADAILNAQVQEELRYHLSPINEQTRFVLPSWCYRASLGIYHDFHAGYLEASELDQLVTQYPQGFTFAQANLPREVVMGWYRDGYLTPLAS
jgi:hypothetical protein